MSKIKKEEDAEQAINKANDNEVEDTKAVEEGKSIVEELQEKLTAALEGKEKCYQDYLRVLADQENLKRRQKKEKEETIRYSHESLFKEFLPVLDSVEKALKETQVEESKSFSAMKEGFELVSKQLKTILEKNGLQVIKTEGATYDPNLHQAVQTEKSDEVTETMIKEEFIKGYKLNNRLLRPSMVSVLLPENSTPRDK